MTLFVHRATSTDVLADGLAELLVDPLPDPFAEEVVAVPTKGVERWLAQRLSHRLGAGSPLAGDARTDGVCAGVRFLNPHSLVAMVLGIENGDPWHPDQLAWPVLRAIDDSLDEPWAGTLAAHLGHRLPPDLAPERAAVEAELRRGRRYAVARRLAGLLSEYGSQRPALLTDWRLGGQGDGLGDEVDEDLAWQPHLWRRVLEIVRVTRGDTPSPDERQARVVAALRAGGSEGGAADGMSGAGGSAPLRLAHLILPGRLSLFGHTRIARSEIDVIDALAEHRDVHLWLPQASPAAWDRLAEATRVGPVRRRDDDSGLLVEHPLLASLGRDARELQRTLALAGTRESVVLARGKDDEPGSQPATLLSLLQADIATDYAPTDEDRATRVIPAEDRSVQIHACHGRARQVEVLRDVLAGLLQLDPTLEPRDILVMCPDVETFAPLIHASFGMGGMVKTSGHVPVTDDWSGHRTDNVPATHPAHTFRVRIADRAPTHTNPVLLLADRLVLLAGGRLTASEVLDLARSAPVRRRFGLHDDDLDRLTDWSAAVVIRWGLDAEHRETYRLRDLTQNTWRAGLDRILVGAAIDGEDVDHVGTTLGLDDLDSGDIDLAGRLAELVARLGATIEAMHEAVTAKEWVEVLREGVLGLADVPHRDAWQIAQLEHELARMGAAAEAAGGAGLALSDVHALLSGRGAGRATRSNFRTGALTVCTMVPMRSVPHRVVALIGLDDGVFPRTTVPDGDDALARQPITGERDPRSEDRQLFLDALLSAGETVVITYAGFDEHTGQERPPAVPLGELVDALRSTASGPGLDRLLTAHPLQPFDARNLGATPEDATPLLPDDRPFSYDPAALRASREALGEREERRTPADVRLSPSPEPEVDLGDLTTFFHNPARAYLRTRLGLMLPEEPEEQSEGIPIELDGLAEWAIGDRVLRNVLAGRDVEGVCNAELWRGELPPHALGWAKLTAVVAEIQDLTRLVWREVGTGGPGIALPREVIDLDVALPSGRRLTGTVTDVVGDKVIRATYSNLGPKHRLTSWITALALAAQGEPHTSHVVARHREYGRRKRVLLSHGGVAREEALELLDQLVDLRDRGLCEPIPLPLKTSAAWAQRYLRDGDQVDATTRAAGEWVSDRNRGFRKEQEDPSHAFVYGADDLPLERILGSPADDERWDPQITSRLGQLAVRVWQPVIEGEHERRRFA